MRGTKPVGRQIGHGISSNVLEVDAVTVANEVSRYSHSHARCSYLSLFNADTTFVKRPLRQPVVARARKSFR